MNLDDELRAALRREDPSPEFAGRVMARARPRRAPYVIWAAAMAAMLVAGFAATYEYREMKSERAARDAVLALRIAANKLNMTRDKVLRLEN
jgi:hypothetical protein